jgi:glutathione S-transferase
MAKDQAKTLWIWPSGIFPRRLVYYLKVKSLSENDLDNLKLSLIPCFVDLQSQDLHLDSISGFEKRPQGYSLPVLRISGAKSSDKAEYVTQSSSILEYLEDLLPETEGFANLRGKNALQAAKIRDIVQLTNELLTWCNVNMRHSTAFSLLWSGMTKEQQSQQASKDAQTQVARLLEKLECWIETSGGISLVGAESPTIADVTVAAAKTSMEEIYGLDLFREFDSLDAWWSRYQASPWFVTRAEIEEVERDGFRILMR